MGWESVNREGGLKVYNLEQQANQAMKRKRLRCAACSKHLIVGNLSYVQVERYVEPYGPSPGRDAHGYWITTSKEYRQFLKGLKKPRKASV